jgi:hypothetical protein
MRSSRTIRRLTALLLVVVLAPSTGALADERHAVSPSVLAEAVSSRLQQQDADRAIIREAIEQPQVREVAAKLGVDLDRTRQLVETMSGDNLRDAAAAAAQINQALVGGQSMTISTTTIIIILLAIILIVVAVD